MDSSDRTDSVCSWGDPQPHRPMTKVRFKPLTMRYVPSHCNCTEGAAVIAV